MRGRPAPYLFAAAGVVVASVATWVIAPWIAPSVSLLFFPAVVLPAVYGGYGAALVATVLSTLALAYFFIPPVFTLALGVDDAIRLLVFASVAMLSGSVSASRRRAEESQRRTLDDLRSTNEMLRRVSDWPPLTDLTLEEGIAAFLDHAIPIVGARRAAVVWEGDDEPSVHVARSWQRGVEQHLPSGSEETDVEAIDAAQRSVLAAFAAEAWTSAPFRTDSLHGRAIFVGLSSNPAASDAIVDLVARQVGLSLDQLLYADRLRRVAVREERIRLARDLHDGVLQSLTGVRLQLQAIAEGRAGQEGREQRLLELERELAREQRELRMFIDDLRPRRSPGGGDAVAARLGEMCERIGSQWDTAVALQVSPGDLALDSRTEEAVRLMVHEGVINALKHGHPTRVAVEVESNDERQVHIAVWDNGRGFPFSGRLDHDAIVRSGCGPASLRERVVSIGGRLAIDSGPDGSRVEISVPRLAGSP